MGGGDVTDDLSRRRKQCTPVRETWLFWLLVFVVGSLWLGAITFVRRWLESRS